MSPRWGLPDYQHAMSYTHFVPHGTFQSASKKLTEQSQLSDEALAGELPDEFPHLQAEQHARQFRDGEMARAGERVDVCGVVRRKKFEDRALCLRQVVGHARRPPRRAGPFLLHLRREDFGGQLRRELCDHVLPLLHELRAGRLDEVVRAEGVARGDVAGDGVDLGVCYRTQAII